MSLYNLYTTSKRHNSTLVPTGGTTGEMVLKAGTSLIKPVFLLYVSAKPTASMVGFEGRFYFVDDIVSVRNGLWELHCSVDVLSTYKSNILNTSAFVLYDTTANTELVDNRLSAKTSLLSARTVDSGTGGFFEDGCIIIGVVGKENTGMFALTVQQFHDIINSIFSNFLDKNDMLPLPSGGFNFSNWDDAVNTVITNITIGLRQMIATGKAPDSIKSCIYVTVPASSFSGNNAKVWLGDFDTDVTAKLLSPTSTATELHNLTIPWIFTDWRRQSPYTYVYLKLPYVGMVPLQVSQIMGATNIGITTKVTQNGQISHIVYVDGVGGNQIYLGRYGGNCGTNILVGASGLNPVNELVGGVALAGAGVMSSLGLAGSVAAMTAVGTAAISGFLGAINPLDASAGSGGGGAYTDDPIYMCYVISHDTNVDPTSVSAFMGTPTRAVKTLVGLTGYVETKCFSVSGDMTDWERQEINRLMDGGVYIE